MNSHVGSSIRKRVIQAGNNGAKVGRRYRKIFFIMGFSNTEVMVKRLFNSLVLSAVLVLVSGFFNAARAEDINCTGDYFFYHFSVTAKSKGQKIVGPMTLLVTRGSSIVRKGTVGVTSSLILIGRSLQFAGGDASGGGNIEAQFNGSAYEGTLSVSSPEGGANVDVTCTAQ